MKKVTERFLLASKEIWEDYHNHPFVRGIADGTLDKEKFRFYILQDYLYLIDYAKVFAIGIAKASDLNVMTYFARYVHQILDGEMDVHNGYMGRFGITEEEVKTTKTSLDNLSYTSYMIRVAYDEDPAAIAAAILSCALSYEVIAREMVEKDPHCVSDPFYGDWISVYASEEYHKENEELITLTEKLCAECTEDQLRHLTDIFVNCSRYEKAFWDMGWEMKK